VIPVYVGFDPREEIGYHVFCSSVLNNTSAPVSFIPLDQRTLGGDYQRDGTNAFIYSRFLVPYLAGYSGWALFADGCDMLCRGDVAELWALRDLYSAVQVVKHDYKTRHPRKYLGTSMEAPNDNYPRKNWSSLMLINCAHFAWRSLTPENIKEMSGAELHRFEWMKQELVGELPRQWNWLADEYGENSEAKLLHWTAGIPAFPAHADAPHAREWFSILEQTKRHAC